LQHLLEQYLKISSFAVKKVFKIKAIGDKNSLGEGEQKFARIFFHLPKYSIMDLQGAERLALSRFNIKNCKKYSRFFQTKRACLTKIVFTGKFQICPIFSKLEEAGSFPPASSFLPIWLKISQSNKILLKKLDNVVTEMFWIYFGYMMSFWIYDNKHNDV